MREIKFRAWHEYGAGIDSGDMAPGMIYDENPGDCLHWKNQGQKIVEVMQFTGRQDGNNQDIYEKDIVDFEGYKATIRFADDRYYFEPHDWDNWCEDWNFTDDYCRCVVIGNEFENPLK